MITYHSVSGVSNVIEKLSIIKHWSRYEGGLKYVELDWWTLKKAEAGISAN